MGSIFQIGMGVWINCCVHCRRDQWMCASTRKVMAWKSLLIPRRRHQIVTLTQCRCDMMQTFVPQTVGASKLRSPRQQHISANIFCNGKICSWMKCVLNRNIFVWLFLWWEELRGSTSKVSPYFPRVYDTIFYCIIGKTMMLIWVPYYQTICGWIHWGGYSHPAVSSIWV